MKIYTYKNYLLILQFIFLTISSSSAITVESFLKGNPIKGDKPIDEGEQFLVQEIKPGSVVIDHSEDSSNIKWETAPRVGFVFQISNQEAQKLLTSSTPDSIMNELLHTMIDSFDVKKRWINRPEKGHFILVRIVENKLHCEYTSVLPYQVFLLKEYDALALQVLDLNGNVREDAQVKFKWRRLGIDSKSKTYRVENDWVNDGDKIVTVELEGFRSVFKIQKYKIPSWDNSYYRYNEEPSFYSYMITDKNRYKPNEKVRFKSYALSQTRTPLHKELQV